MPKSQMAAKDLLDLLDSDEQEELLSLLVPKDQGSKKSGDLLAELENHSFNYVLGLIIHMRADAICMLQEISNFLATVSLTPRTTKYGVLFEEKGENFEINIDENAMNCITVSLKNRGRLSEIDNIGAKINNLSFAIRRDVDIHGTPKDVDTHISGLYKQASQMPQNRHKAPAYEYARKIFQRRELFFSPHDAEILEKIFQKIARIKGLLDNHGLDLSAKRGALFQKIFFSLNDLLDHSKKKLHYARSHLPREWVGGIPRKITDTKERDIFDKLNQINELLVSLLEFEKSAGNLFDFLKLPFWKQAWRIYEVWVMIHIITTFKLLGYKFCPKDRISNGVWDLKYTKDSEPICKIVKDDHELKLFYQLYSRSEDQGDMPDIAIKDEAGDVLLICDPKYGKSYRKTDLDEVALRYHESFQSALTLIVNFFDMKYSFEKVKNYENCFVASDIKPNSLNLDTLTGLVAKLSPKLKGSMGRLILVDRSGSMSGIEDTVVQCIQNIIKDTSDDALSICKTAFFNETISHSKTFLDFIESPDIPPALGVENYLNAIQEAVVFSNKNAMVESIDVFLVTDGQGDTGEEIIKLLKEQSTTNFHLIEIVSGQTGKLMHLATLGNVKHSLVAPLK